MTPDQRLWSRTRDDLVRAVESLGFRGELGEAIARHLGSPKAMERMISYLRYVKPKTEELVVDEMLAIRSEIDAWKEKRSWTKCWQSGARSMPGKRRRPAKKQMPDTMRC